MHLNYITPLHLETLVDATREGYRHAAARAVSGTLPVPALPVESPGEHFASTLATLGNRMLATFNEARPLDYKTGCELVRAYWLARYSVVHSGADDAIVNGSYIKPCALDVFGITDVMNQTDIEFLNTNSDQVLKCLGNCILSARKMHAAFILPAAA